MFSSFISRRDCPMDHAVIEEVDSRARPSRIPASPPSPFRPEGVRTVLNAKYSRLFQDVKGKEKAGKC